MLVLCCNAPYTYYIDDHFLTGIMLFIQTNYGGDKHSVRYGNIIVMKEFTTSVLCVGVKRILRSFG